MMTIAELAGLVAELRRAQREYFRTRSDGKLDEAERLERRVDLAIADILGQQPLFPE